ncbi:MAG: CPBP family intramembrane glutamic endopeptidase [Parvibaculum sp.]|uniref:CPBP family intramembrane glutamic endopeptidase n=1 Tax=Parvibaculum sp. TaxID=2024848 RepID=UPI0032631D09
MKQEMSGSSDARLTVFFVLVFVLSVPFWLAGYALGELPDLIPIDLPVSALMAFTPAAAALILVWRAEGRSGAAALLKRAGDFRRVTRKRWFLAAFLFMPGILTASFLLMRMMGAPLPDPAFSLAALPVFFVMFLAAGLGEEIGWQGYAYDAMERKWKALGAALLLGAIWTLWHIIPYFQTGHGATWVLWHCLVTVLLRVATVWIYVNGGRSVFLAALFHAMCNVAYFLFPNFGSHYDPAYTFPVLAAACTGVVLLWGPATLAGFRFARKG